MAKLGQKKRLGINDPLKKAFQEVMSDASGQAYHDELSVDLVDIDPNNHRQLEIEPGDIRRDLASLAEGEESFAEVLSRLDARDLVNDGVSLNDRAIQDLDDLRETALSILAVGVVQSIRVYARGNRYSLIAGERRYLASLMAGAPTIPANVFPDPPPVTKIRLMQYVENVHRVDLSLYEQVIAQRDLVDTMSREKGGERVTGPEIAKTLGLSRYRGFQVLRLASLPEEVMGELREGRISSKKVLERLASAHEAFPGAQFRQMLDSAVAATSERDALEKIAQLESQGESGDAGAAAQQEKKPGPKRTEKTSLGSVPAKKATFILRTLLESEAFAGIEIGIEPSALDGADPAEIRKAWKKLIEAIEDQDDEAK
ncbi:MULTISPECIES: ParB/RepB/Spo0J family partition protein [unclassified Thioalkalivibrio]|uniref:ParB/RepB/Spo0J family partition protein n=1 Tax=unclassified Thioalkalivibrio TaxID=2621013 RepID=UPI0003651F26|nr:MULTISPECIES: ParB/RepB/Spo0J family partition protein [unclassified Thioalkalivibrio]